jgi:hypothetical protein
MIYCWVRDTYVEQNEVCVLCKNYELEKDACKTEEKK